MKMGVAEASGTGRKKCGVPWGKLDLYKQGMLPNKPFFKTQAYKMIGFGAWKLTWGTHFVRSRFLFFFGVHRCFLGNHTKHVAQPIL